MITEAMDTIEFLSRLVPFKRFFEILNEGKG